MKRDERGCSTTVEKPESKRVHRVRRDKDSDCDCKSTGNSWAKSTKVGGRTPWSRVGVAGKLLPQLLYP